jgi:hypothetical protein
MDSPVISTLVSFAKICSEKREEAIFKGNKYNLKNFFENLEDKFNQLNFYDEFDNLIISRLIYAKEFKTDSNYAIQRDIVRLYNKIEDKNLFDKIGKKFYDELKYK